MVAYEINPGKETRVIVDLLGLRRLRINSPYLIMRDVDANITAEAKASINPFLVAILLNEKKIAAVIAYVTPSYVQIKYDKSPY